MYLNGLGVEKDYSQAFSWCSKAANQGLNLAQLNLALMYEEGFGCKANPSKALDLYRESAERGCSEAQHKLGVIYLYGQCDVEKNYHEAIQWFTKASEKHPESQFFLGLMYEGGQGVKKDLQAALKWYQKAASAGFQDAKDKIKELENE